MTAQEIYNKVKTCGNSIETTVCHLHQPQRIPCCLDAKYKCAHVSTSRVLDLDTIVSDYCKSKGLKTYSSTDALSFKADNLLFVEIKGWKKFIEHQLQNKHDETKIKAKEESYNLNKKLEDSIVICQQMISPNNFISDNNIVYILVIDTDTNPKDAKSQLPQNLNILAYNSSSIYITISDITDAHLHQSVKRTVRKIRTYCQNFDSTYANL
jgi:hypothetical protein